MRTQLKSALALFLALLICISVFAACKGEEGDDTSSAPLISTVSIPSEIEIDITTGEATMAYGSTYADLKADLVEKGEYLEDQGEVLQLFQADKVTEITDEATVLESGMVIVKKNADGEVLFELTLVIAAQVTSVSVDSEGNTVIQYQDGKVEVVNSQNEVISTSSTTPVVPTSSTTTATPSGTTTLVPSVTPSDDPSSTVSIDPSDRPSITSSIPSAVVNDEYELTIAGDDSNNALVMAVMAFQREHENIKLRIVPAMGADGNIKYTSLDGLKMQLASGNAPDVVIMDSVYVAAGGYQNYLLDLQQFGSEEIKSLFIDSCWQAVKSQIEGQTAQFGLPFDCNTIMQFYNKDLLDKAGVKKAPTTWDEMTAAMELLKAIPEVTYPTVVPVNPQNIGHKNYAAFSWMMWLWRLGGEVLNSDLSAAAFAEQPGIDALQMYVDLVTKYNVPKSFEEGAFGAGTVGFMQMINNVYDWTFRNPTAGITFGVDLLPELKEGIPRYSGLGLYAIALPNKITSAGDNADRVAEATARAKWAYEFIKFYTTSETYQLQYCESVLLMPSLKSCEGQGLYQGEYWAVAYEQLRTSKFRPGVKNWDSIEIYISEAINAAINNTKSPKEALNAAAIATNRQLA